MVVLTAIGAFFARIWRWIKETAWVQPLLIVGIIFGVIFSIPSIVRGIEALSNNINSSEAYYHKFEKSLVNGKDSEADKLTQAINSAMEDNSKVESVRNELGQKFFLAYVSDDCTSCAEAREGFETLENNFSNFVKDSSVGFKMYTIFTDEVTDDTTTNETAFVKYMDRNAAFLEESAGVGYSTDYYINGKISDTDLEYVEQCDPTNFLTPTIFLVDLTDKSPTIGVSEIMFGVTGDTNVAKAQLLADCWQHTGDFSSESN